MRRQDPAGHIFCLECSGFIGRRVGKIEGDLAHSTVSSSHEVQKVQKGCRAASFPHFLHFVQPARRVLRWIRAKGQRDVSVKDVRRDALGQSIDARQTEQLLQSLEQAGRLRKETAPTSGRPIHRWQVNPCSFAA
jgi:hypothetical protein